MKVTIRVWKLKKGDCLYLDCFHKGQRIRENTHLILTGDKKTDAEKTRKAEILRARKELELVSQIHGMVAEHRSIVPLVTYAQEVGSASVGRQLEYLRSFFGMLQLRAATASHFEGYQAHLTAEGLAPSTVETYMNSLVAAMNKAVMAKLIPANPAKGLKRVRAEQKPAQSLTDTELAKLRETPIPGDKGGHGLGAEIKRAFLFSCMTGLRWSDDKNLTRSKVRVSSTGRMVEATQIKTGTPVYIPINDAAWALISARYEVCAPTDRIFPMLNETDPNQYLWQWGTNAGIGRIHFHQSRHTFPRFLANEGVDIATIQKLLGHKDIHTTMRYVQASNRHLVDAVKRINL